MAGSHSVFLSYASQDAAAAARISSALRAAGVEVWFDQGELRGGDLWDQDIRQRIRDCQLFIPVISSATQARSEGYFRLEWKLAVDRSHLMATDQRFIVPVVIDDYAPTAARVPERFHDYQWTQLPAGEPTPQFVQLVAALTMGREEHPLGAGQPSTALKILDGQTGARRRPHRRLLGASLAATLLLLAIAVILGLRGTTTITPYSANDRRMTFAVLPFVAPARDARAAEVAAANSEASVAALERNAAWAHTVDRASVRQATAQVMQPREIAKTLDVHFLLRGTVAKIATGYSVGLNMIDGETERTIGSGTLTVVDPSLTPARNDDIDDALAGLIFDALKIEVERAKSRPDRKLDVRDLTFRAYVYWYQNADSPDAEGYRTAQNLLDRALSVAPTDFLALKATAEINLCDCISAWSKDMDKETNIGAAAVDKLARLYPNISSKGLRLKVLMLRGRYAEALSLTESVLRHDEDDVEALQYRVASLIHLGRATEALPLTKILERKTEQQTWVPALIAAVEYAVGNYESAVLHARSATAAMTDAEFKNATQGPVRLTLAAAEARLGHMEEARSTMAQFWASVPHARTASEIRHWMYPTADLYEFQPLLDGLRLAGVGD
jgi:TolB-like protein